MQGVEEVDNFGNGGDRMDGHLWDLFGDIYCSEFNQDNFWVVVWSVCSDACKLSYHWYT